MQKSLRNSIHSQRVNFLRTLLISTVRGSPCSFLSLAEPGKVLYFDQQRIRCLECIWQLPPSNSIHILCCLQTTQDQQSQLSKTGLVEKGVRFALNEWHSVKVILRYNQRSQSLSSLSAGFIVARLSQDDKHVLALFPGGLEAFSEEHASFCWPAKNELARCRQTWEVCQK